MDQIKKHSRAIFLAIFAVILILVTSGIIFYTLYFNQDSTVPTSYPDSVSTQTSESTHVTSSEETNLSAETSPIFYFTSEDRTLNNTKLMYTENFSAQTKTFDLDSSIGKVKAELSPDGRLLALFGYQLDTIKIYDLDSETVVKEIDEVKSIGRIDWSPDSSKLLATQLSGNVSDSLYLVDLLNNSITTLVENGLINTGFNSYWIDNDNFIYLARDGKLSSSSNYQFGKFSVYKTNASTLNTEKLLTPQDLQSYGYCTKSNHDAYELYEVVNGKINIIFCKFDKASTMTETPKSVREYFSYDIQSKQLTKLAEKPIAVEEKLLKASGNDILVDFDQNNYDPNWYIFTAWDEIGYNDFDRNIHSDQYLYVMNINEPNSIAKIDSAKFIEYISW